MSQRNMKMMVPLEDSVRTLFQAGAILLGITPAQLAANLISDWTALNLRELAKVAAPAGTGAAQLEQLVADETPAPPAGRRRAVRDVAANPPKPRRKR